MLKQSGCNDDFIIYGGTDGNAGNMIDKSESILCPSESFGHNATPDNDILVT